MIESFVGERLASVLGYEESPRHGHPDRKLRLTDGVILKEFKVIKPARLVINELKNQTRNKGLQAANLLAVRNEMKAKSRLDYPIYSTVDPLTGVETVESGHHRFDIAKSLYWPGIPVSVV